MVRSALSENFIIKARDAMLTQRDLSDNSDFFGKFS